MTCLAEFLAYLISAEIPGRGPIGREIGGVDIVACTAGELSGRGKGEIRGNPHVPRPHIDGM
jgi:hypothetical protein